MPALESRSAVASPVAGTSLPSPLRLCARRERGGDHHRRAPSALWVSVSDRGGARWGKVDLNRMLVKNPLATFS